MNEMKKERIGIYGGTFSPPHLGHVRAAELFLATVPVDSLLIVPDCLPPHKEPDGEATDEDRLDMCRAAFGHLPKTVITDMEIRRGGKSFTSQTLTELTRPDREIFLLCGTDMFLTLDTWHDPDTVFRLATPCFVRRENDPETAIRLAGKQAEYLRRFGRKCLAVPGEALEISSSELRREIGSGSQTAGKYLPESVFGIIRERRLYAK